MKSTDPIICKPTPWFIFRGVVIFLLFGFFAIWFFKDGLIGYRKQNEQFYLYRTFAKAVADFERMSIEGSRVGEVLDAKGWLKYVEAQRVGWPQDKGILPSGVEVDCKWPTILSEYDKVKEKNVKKLWQEYAGERQFSVTPPEHEFGRGKITEQWVAFGVCTIMSIGAGWILLRTLRRTLVATEEGVVGADGVFVRFEEMKSLDLRKWETKGLAYVNYEQEGKKGRMRLDGLTYGGFKIEQGEPAEMLMRRIKSQFQGEIIDYVMVEESGARGGEEKK